MSVIKFSMSPENLTY